MPAMRDDLRLLSVFHWVLAAMAAAFSLLSIFQIALGATILRGTIDSANPPPDVFGWLFVGIGVLFLAAGFSYAAALVVAGRFIAQARHWTFVIVVAAVSCAFFPFGTTLGVFTIIVLSKPEVKALFHPSGPVSPGVGPST